MSGFPNRGDRGVLPDPIPFPSIDRSLAEFMPASAGHALEAIETMSRRIDDLARELDCLGYFDDGDDDRPRAA